MRLGYRFQDVMYAALGGALVAAWYVSPTPLVGDASGVTGLLGAALVLIAIVPRAAS